MTAIRWTACLDQPASWYGGDEAIRIADNVLLYQRRAGGWPKNIDMATPLAADEATRVAAGKGLADSTIDNGATTTQIRYLARVVAATGLPRFRDAIVVALDYLFSAELPAGGWPQYFPLRDDYSRLLTFNDSATVRVLDLMGEVTAARPGFAFVDAGVRRRATWSVERGTRVILASQVRVGGTLTGWCAQYDPASLEPRGARTYEHPSIDGRETVDVVRYLMRIQRPAPAVVGAVQAAVRWLQGAKVTGWRVAMRPDPGAPRGVDRVLVADPAAPPLWARFYEIGTNRPIYSGRDGVIKYSLAEIEIERRTGYNWIDRFAADLLEREYPAWSKRVGR